MNLFIGNLARTTTEADLLALLRLPRSGAARRLRIFRRSDRDGRPLRFGLVRAESAADLRRLLDRARTVGLDGQSWDVREFVPRAAGNERRAVSWRSRPWPHAERRKAERRAGS